MSKSEFDLELHFLPAWAQEDDKNRYANYSGDTRGERRGGFRDGDRKPGRGGGGGGGGGGRPGGGRPGGGGDRRPQGQGQGQGPRPGGARPGGQGGPGGQRGPSQGGRPRQDRGGHDRPQQRPEPLPQIELNVSFKPDAKGVESLARQIRMTGRAYPLFDIAQMILRKPERHTVTVSTQKKADGTTAQRLFSCALDDSPHLSEDEAVRYVLSKHFQTFYQPEKTQIEAPKGTYTFVAQCGMSGVILGPPNHHDYQNQLRKLHAARFARMPFEAYKARVKIVRDEEVVKKWLEDQSWTTEYICLNMPEPLKLASREEVEKHFRETHLGNIIKEIQEFTLTGAACAELKSAPLLRLVRSAWEDQKRFPLQIATVLSQQFASHGLQFFKVNKTVTHVAVARPHYLDLEAEPVSDGVRRIVEHVEAHPKCTRKQLVSALLGRPATEAPKPQPAPKAKPQPAPESAATPEPATGDNTAEGESNTTTVEAAAPGTAAAAPAAEPAAPEPAPQPELSPEETAIVADLHWVIHQGHIIEFANGQLETAKKPLPRPEKKKKEPAAAAPETPQTEAASDPTAPTATSSDQPEPAPVAATPQPEPPAPTETPAPASPTVEASADTTPEAIAPAPPGEEAQANAEKQNQP